MLAKLVLVNGERASRHTSIIAQQKNTGFPLEFILVNTGAGMTRERI